MHQIDFFLGNYFIVPFIQQFFFFLTGNFRVQFIHQNSLVRLQQEALRNANIIILFEEETRFFFIVRGIIVFIVNGDPANDALAETTGRLALFLLNSQLTAAGIFVKETCLVTCLVLLLVGRFRRCICGGGCLNIRWRGCSICGVPLIIIVASPIDLIGVIEILSSILMMIARRNLWLWFANRSDPGNGKEIGHGLCSCCCSCLLSMLLWNATPLLSFRLFS
mmetsp:Transcript_44907/g.108519  ORF Transcript_44907/g.108519 Transcript_44907/m.108519 type:complete len:222 (+) Transcript_44907:1247-1912(+)